VLAPHGHLILFPSHPVFAFSPYCCLLSTDAYSRWFDPSGARTHDLLHSRL